MSVLFPLRLCVLGSLIVYRESRNRCCSWFLRELMEEPSVKLCNSASARMSRLSISGSALLLLLSHLLSFTNSIRNIWFFLFLPRSLRLNSRPVNTLQADASFSRTNWLMILFSGLFDSDLQWDDKFIASGWKFFAFLLYVQEAFGVAFRNWTFGVFCCASLSQNTPNTRQ